MTAHPFTIRLARAEDVGDIFNIRTAVRENHLSMEQLAARGITPLRILDVINTASCLWVAEDANGISGFSMADNDSACVYALFVHPRAEGRGMGSALLKMAEDYLFADHALIWLVTDDSADVRSGGFYRGVPCRIPGMQKRRQEPVRIRGLKNSAVCRSL